MTTTDAETPEPNEEALIASIIQVMQHQLDRDYEPRATRRDAHPKHTGLLEATFTVLGDLPAQLRVGLFAQPRSYSAWVRTSNASTKVKSDAEADVRGFAIKVLGVDGLKIPDSDEPDTQDFVLLSTPNMPLGTVKLFRDAIYYSTKWSIVLFAAKMAITGRAGLLKQLSALRIAPPSPLEIRYWSTTPYLLGPEQVVKYSLLPTSGTPTAMPDQPGEKYLTEAMERRLATDTVTFDFAVQLRKPDMPILDAAPRWDETVSPFVRVATLTISPQTFRTAERAELAEALSFSPAHARVEHRPVGPINRARMRVYRTNSDFRHTRRGVAKTTG
jgi:hypothetical protein